MTTPPPDSDTWSVQAAATARSESVKAFVDRALRNELAAQEKANQRAAEYLAQLRAEGSEYNAVVLIEESDNDS
jgi:hypothetical protein